MLQELGADLSDDGRAVPGPLRLWNIVVPLLHPSKLSSPAIRL